MPCDTSFRFHSAALCLAVSERKNGPNELGQIYNISSPTPYIQTSPTRANNNFGIYMHDIKMSCQDEMCMCTGEMHNANCSMGVCDATQFEALMNY